MSILFTIFDQKKEMDVGCKIQVSLQDSYLTRCITLQYELLKADQCSEEINGYLKIITVVLK